MTALRVIVKHPGRAPQVAMIDGALNSLQHVVGGFIEVMHIGGGMDLVFNEEGLLLGLKRNAQIFGGAGTAEIVGSMFFVGVDVSVGAFRSLTDAQTVLLLSRWRHDDEGFVFYAPEVDIVNASDYRDDHATDKGDDQ